jgi:5-formyltetrahydrofolate cyclo-ligase
VAHNAAVTKQQWRARLLAARTARPAPERALARDLVTAHLLALVRPESSMTVCAYHSLPSEPLAADLPALLASNGCRVLVPVASAGRALDWCELDPVEGTACGMLGVPEPTGPRLGPRAIRSADVVLVPALAVDSTGVRLGRGGGHYDRSLALLSPSEGAAGEDGDEDSGTCPDGASSGGDENSGRRPRLIAVVFDDEVVDRLPRDEHDVPVTEVLTPGGGLRHVARGGPRGASSN